jgi:uncharacterized protein (UPF0218 family)
VKTLKITDKIKKKLKKPLGILLKGNAKENALIIKNLIKSENPPKIITVGDIVTENLLKSGINIDLYIIDKKTLRGKYEPDIKLCGKLKIKNIQGTINSEIWNSIDKVLSNDKENEIIIDGEEDLLGLPCVILAPKGSYVIYGQPNEGMVLIKVTDKKKLEVQRIIDSMEEE